MTASEFIKSLPQKADPAALEGMQTTFHFVIDGEGGGDYTVSINDGEMTVATGLLGDPKCVVKAKNDNFMKVLRGEINPMVAMMTGKVKISNQGELLKYAKVFGLM